MPLKKEPYDPRCSRCGTRHFNFQPCADVPKPVVPVFKHPPGQGFRVSTGWGVNTKGVPVTFRMPAQTRMGKLTPPEAA